MNRKIISLSLLSLSLCACSGINDNKHASGDFDYAKNVEATEITIPNNLLKPKKSTKYFITSNINKNGPVGKNLDIRGPSLVLPVATSSRVELNSGESKIWFDQVIEEHDLKEFIYQAIKDKLVQSKVALKTIDEAKMTYESEWFHKEKETGVLFFKSNEVVESVRFKYQLETKPHGRSVAITVNLIDFTKKDESGDINVIDPIDKQRAEMAMLNQIVAHVDYKYRQYVKETRLKRSNQKLVTIGKNTADEDAYLVEITLDSLWSNMPTFFEQYGFTITDLNESKKVYYVDFVKPDSSFWSQIWGEETLSLALEDAKYQFILEQIESKTSVSIYDKDGNVLSKEMLTKLFSVMEQGLSFRNL
ncbi:MAG: outer membrane protein assembly factor BamC [Alteromonadaceae bacterium]|nr:outer membrane protein assembly factor BamC [Alteromonadaceae bacterium]